MHAADWAILGEPALTRGIMDHPATRRSLRPSYPLEDGRADPAANAVGSTWTSHLLIIPGPGFTSARTHPEVLFAAVTALARVAGGPRSCILRRTWRRVDRESLVRRGYAPAMADEVELILQLPRDSAVDRQLREDPPLSVSDGRVVIERFPADAEGRILPPPAGEVVLSVLSPETLSREAEQVRLVIRRAAADGGPLVVLVQAAEELRDDELAAVLDAAARTRRVVLLRVLGGI